jgi:RNA polymerase sigma factor (sigma-70 family)
MVDFEMVRARPRDEQGMTGKTPPRPTFEDVYRDQAAYVRRALRRLGVPERHCEDALHDVFVVVFRRLPEYEPRDRLTGWLMAIAKNVAAKQRRRDNREPLMDQDLEKDAGIDLEQQSTERKHRELLLSLLDTLELERRAVLVMHDFDELSVPEIARLLVLPEGTVWTRLRLAHKDLEEAWSRMEAAKRRDQNAVLPLGLAALMDAERPIPPMPDGAHERVLARLQHVREIAPEHRETPDDGPSAAAPRAAGGLSRAMASLAVGGALVVGVALGAVWDPLHRPAHESTVLPPVTVARAAPAPVSTEAPSVAPPTSATAPPSATASSVASQDITMERALMDQAARALARGDIAGAFVAVQEHAHRFPGGQLVEEREAYRIAALVRAGRTAEAREGMDRFTRAYPNSVRLNELRRALGTAGAPTP